MRTIGQRWILLVMVSCASPKAETPAPVTARVLPPTAHSSIAAVIDHRTELGLTDDQVQKLQARDQIRDKVDASLRDELAAASHGSSSGSTSGSSSPSQAGSLGGGVGGRHGGGRGGHAARPAADAPGSRAEALQQKLDDDDTQAYLDVQSVFTDAQRDRAGDLAGAYREQLFDSRKSP